MVENMIIFDTLACANKLQEVGFTKEQAEVQTHVITEMLERNLASKRDIADTHVKIEELRTDLKRDIEELRIDLKHDIADTHVKIEELRIELKRDIEELRIELKHDIEELRTDLKHDIAQLSDKMTIKLGGIMVVGIAVIAAIQKLL